jgi:hypothetical protein
MLLRYELHLKSNKNINVFIWQVEDSMRELCSISHIHGTMRITLILNPLEDVAEDDNRAIYGDSVQTHGINTVGATYIDGDEEWEEENLSPFLFLRNFFWGKFTIIGENL